MTQETKIIAGISIVTLLIVGAAAFLLGGTPSDKPQATQKVDQAILTKDATHVIKAPNAKVTIVEFADYQCPACKAAHPVVKQILEEYKGKVNFVFRNFPLQMHPNAKPAAQAAESAGKQGKYWEMHDYLYDNQTQWENEKNIVDTLKEYATDLKLDQNKLAEEVKNEAYKNIIEKDIALGNSVGVNATPTFFINGEQYSRVLSYDEFKNIIDTALK